MIVHDPLWGFTIHSRCVGAILELWNRSDCRYFTEKQIAVSMVPKRCITLIIFTHLVGDYFFQILISKLIKNWILSKKILESLLYRKNCKIKFPSQTFDFCRVIVDKPKKKILFVLKIMRPSFWFHNTIFKYNCWINCKYKKANMAYWINMKCNLN